MGHQPPVVRLDQSGDTGPVGNAFVRDRVIVRPNSSIGYGVAGAASAVGGGYAAAVRYMTVGPTRFHAIYRSARNLTRLSCQRLTRTVVASGGDVGALSICSDASRDASIVTPPSSAYKIRDGC